MYEPRSTGGSWASVDACSKKSGWAKELVSTRGHSCSLTRGEGFGVVCWVPKFWKLRSWLYRRRFIQLKTHFAAFFETYEIDTLLHFSKSKICKTILVFLNISSNFLDFAKNRWHFINICHLSSKMSRNFAGFAGNPRYCWQSVSFQKFPEHLTFEIFCKIGSTKG